jgi:hypothetical protein
MIVPQSRETPAEAQLRSDKFEKKKIIRTPIS